MISNEKLNEILDQNEEKKENTMTKLENAKNTEMKDAMIGGRRYEFSIMTSGDNRGMVYYAQRDEDGKILKIFTTNIEDPETAIIISQNGRIWLENNLSLERITITNHISTLNSTKLVLTAIVRK